MADAKRIIYILWCSKGRRGCPQSWRAQVRQGDWQLCVTTHASVNSCFLCVCIDQALVRHYNLLWWKWHRLVHWIRQERSWYASIFLSAGTSSACIQAMLLGQCLDSLSWFGNYTCSKVWSKETCFCIANEQCAPSSEDFRFSTKVSFLSFILLFFLAKSFGLQRCILRLQRCILRSFERSLRCCCS